VIQPALKHEQAPQLIFMVSYTLDVLLENLLSDFRIEKNLLFPITNETTIQFRVH
jgi:hypothetical protein